MPLTNHEQRLYQLCLNRSIDEARSILYHNDGALNNCLLHACETGNSWPINTLRQLGADDYHGGLASVCRAGDNENYVQIAQMMIKCGANNLREALSIACQYGRVNIAGLLIRYNADVNEGLLMACRYGHADIARLMLERGARAVDDGLSKARQYGHANIASLMLEHGARDASNVVQG